jgi:hypothetical protein
VEKIPLADDALTFGMRKHEGEGADELIVFFCLVVAKIAHGVEDSEDVRRLKVLPTMGHLDGLLIVAKEVVELVFVMVN